MLSTLQRRRQFRPDCGATRAAIVSQWPGQVALIGTMLIATIAVLPGCGAPAGVGALKRIKAAESQAIAAIEEAGGTVKSKAFGPYTAYAVDLRTAAIEDALLEHLALVEPIGSINLSGSPVTDEQMLRLAKVGSLKTLGILDISGTSVSNKGLMAFVDHQLLFMIKVADSQVTPVGIKKFRAQHPKNSQGMPLQVK